MKIPRPSWAWPFEREMVTSSRTDFHTFRPKRTPMPKHHDPDHKHHQYSKAIEAQLHLLTVGELKTLLRMATTLATGGTDYPPAPAPSNGYGVHDVD